MAGVTDAVFRKHAWDHGVGYMVGEMTTGRADLWDTDKSRARRVRVPEAVHAVQIAGADTDVLADSARRLWEAGAQIIDINFGCPAKKVCRKAAGSALLADPDRVQRLAAAAVAAVPVPVTAKLRTGPNPEWRNAPEVARRLEDVGVQALVLHGRTRACRFLGQAEFDTVAETKRRVAVPVFANGDLADAATVRRVLAQTGVDGVMIGRAALGAPWLPGQIAAALARGDAGPGMPGLAQRLHELRAQLRAMHDFYGEPTGVRMGRKHIQWTLTHPTLRLSARQQQALSAISQRAVRATSAAEQLDTLAAPWSQAA